jgi:hypothetical protein
MTAPYIGKKKRPGVEFREQQVREAAQDVDPAAEAKAEDKMGVMGGSSDEPSHRNLASRRRALARLREALKSKGESEYQE